MLEHLSRFDGGNSQCKNILGCLELLIFLTFVGESAKCFGRKFLELQWAKSQGLLSDILH